MLKIAICDDDKDFLFQIKSFISSWGNKPNNLIMQTFEDGDTLIHAHTESPFDIIILDVVMPLLNGIETAREIREQDKSVKLAFLTSSPEFAVDSYTVKANNYLLKPIKPEKLYCCLDEFQTELRQNTQNIIVKSNNAVQRVELNSIEYIESQNKHVIFTLSDGRTIRGIEPLYTYENKLIFTDYFFKCHRSYIVNLHQIDTYTTKEIKMRSGYLIPISRKYHHEFETIYFSYIFRKAGEES